MPPLETCYAHSWMKGSEQSCKETCLTLFSVFIREREREKKKALVFVENQFIGLVNHNFAESPS